MDNNSKKDITRKLKDSSSTESGEHVLLGGTPSFTFAYKKLKRLATALYMVTSLIPHEEPLRVALRSACVGTLTSLLSLKTYADDRSLEAVSASLFQITALLEVASGSGYISSMNSEVLHRECIMLAELLHERKNDFLSQKITVSDKFFDIGTVDDIAGLTDTGVLKEKEMFSTPQSAGIKDTIKDIKIFRPRQKQLQQGLVGERRNYRRDTILKLLKKQSKISVKNVAEVIHNCSEKTLQRELLSLVEEGVLIKEGERRWSTYILAS